MRLKLPLDKMTVPEKLRAMEEIWDSLQGSPEDVPSPAWHKDVLKARARSLKNGTAKMNDWEEAKKRIREKTR